jgi:hypothetical protein
MKKSLNTIIGNAKRFMAYEIIKRLKEQKNLALLEEIYASVKKKERKKVKGTKYSKIVLMQKNAIQTSLCIRN